MSSLPLLTQFCQRNHGVDFKLAKKASPSWLSKRYPGSAAHFSLSHLISNGYIQSEVNGANQNQVFAWLKQQEKGKGLMGTSVVKCEHRRCTERANGKCVMA